MKVRDLKQMLESFDPDLEVWSVHPEAEIQWGPIRGVCKAITDRLQKIALIDTRVTEEKEHAQGVRQD